VSRFLDTEIPWLDGSFEHDPDPALVAAADVMTGAMVALVPSDVDAQRLALAGGEPVEQMHLTLVYLGDAVDINEAQRAELIDAGRDMVLGWNGVAAEAFAPAIFNPTGPEPCAVLICSGAELAEFYETAMADVTEIVDLPDDLHAPWIPHVSLAYLSGTIQTGSSEKALIDFMSSATGPVTFDRLRFAFAGEITDIPIVTAPRVPAPPPDEATTEDGDVAVVEAAAEPEPVVASSTPMAPDERAAFDGCWHCYGPAHVGACRPGY